VTGDITVIEIVTDTHHDDITLVESVFHSDEWGLSPWWDDGGLDYPHAGGHWFDQPEDTDVLLAMGVVAGVTGAGFAGWWAGTHRQHQLADALEPDGQGSSEDERGVLRDAIHEVIDLVPSPALQRRLSDVLAQVGVQRGGAAIGDPYDPDVHVAVGTDDTDDAALDGRIADVEREGLLDRGDLVDPPQVRVLLHRPAE
jgi:hypothetical protein